MSPSMLAGAVVGTAVVGLLLIGALEYLCFWRPTARSEDGDAR